MSKPPDRLPVHVAIIMDGNGRWAKERGVPRTEGHIAGVASARAVVECCRELGVQYLTLYAFSTENWSRPRSEVRFLMKQLRNYLRDRRDEFVENGIRFNALGRLSGLPVRVQEEIEKTRKATEDCSGLALNLAVNYGSRSEIADACGEVAAEVASGTLPADGIDEDIVSRHLYTAGIPDPDLLIRTGGEMRLSNFLLWQFSYTELYFTDTLWPDFGREEFVEALRDFAGRRRRFGAVPESECAACDGGGS